MTSEAFEAFLARLYVDSEFRARFLAEPRNVAQQAGLNEAECQALESIDRAGLELASASFAAKRNKQPKGKPRRWWRF